MKETKHLFYCVQRTHTTPFLLLVFFMSNLFVRRMTIFVNLINHSRFEYKQTNLLRDVIMNNEVDKSHINDLDLKKRKEEFSKKFNGMSRILNVGMEEFLIKFAPMFEHINKFDAELATKILYGLEYQAYEYDENNMNLMHQIDIRNTHAHKRGGKTPEAKEAEKLNPPTSVGKVTQAPKRSIPDGHPQEIQFSLEHIMSKQEKDKKCNEYCLKNKVFCSFMANSSEGNLMGKNKECQKINNSKNSDDVCSTPQVKKKSLVMRGSSKKNGDEETTTVSKINDVPILFTYLESSYDAEVIIDTVKLLKTHDHLPVVALTFFHELLLNPCVRDECMAKLNNHFSTLSPGILLQIIAIAYYWCDTKNRLFTLSINQLGHLEDEEKELIVENAKKLVSDIPGFDRVSLDQERTNSFNRLVNDHYDELRFTPDQKAKRENKEVIKYNKHSRALIKAKAEVLNRLNGFVESIDYICHKCDKNSLDVMFLHECMTDKRPAISTTPYEFDPRNPGNLFKFFEYMTSGLALPDKGLKHNGEGHVKCLLGGKGLHKFLVKEIHPIVAVFATFPRQDLLVRSAYDGYPRKKGVDMLKEFMAVAKNNKHLLNTCFDQSPAKKKRGRRKKDDTNEDETDDTKNNNYLFRFSKELHNEFKKSGSQVQVNTTNVSAAAATAAAAAAAATVDGSVDVDDDDEDFEGNDADDESESNMTSVDKKRLICQKKINYVLNGLGILLMKWPTLCKIELPWFLRIMYGA